MEISKSQKGKDKILYKGYSYRQGNVNLRTINWRCSHDKCKGSLSTPKQYEAGNVLPKELKSHNHPPQSSVEKSTKRKAKKRMMESNPTNGIPAIIIKTEPPFNDSGDDQLVFSNESTIILSDNTQNTKAEIFEEVIEPEPKMTPQEKAQCVTWFIETKSDAQTQRIFRTFMGRRPPSRSTIREMYKMFLETGSVLGDLIIH